MLLVCVILVSKTFALGQQTSAAEDITLSKQAQILLHETFRLGNKMQNDVWPGWSEAPFAVLLVTQDHEFLVRHPGPSDDFDFFKYDEVIGDSIYVRARQFPPGLRATFPAVGGVPTIVMGLPDSTESPTDWVLTALHEHFHQWQMSQPDYYSAVNDLGLSGGDNTGQWMLNYPFPYDSAAVQYQFRELTNALKTALEARNTPGFTQELEAYLKTRQLFQSILRSDEYRYFSFQVWQEGVARYVEYKTGEWAKRNYEPTEAFRQLDGFESFDEVTEKIKERIMNRLSAMSLKDDRRTAFYPIGAAEVLLLDELNPDWQQKYWTEKFHLEHLFVVDR